MIKLENIIKSYQSRKGTVLALSNVSLEIKRGDIFGIIGYSGAGKSTLLRCINLLERPDSGKVIINSTEVTTLTQKDLRKIRGKIGMIFQHFNLMNRRNVFNNVAYPLKGKGLSREEIERKVLNLLELVGIQDKAYAYPSQLSGGQKQRVGVARALANDPEVLLCDEATSALDPQTTRGLLNLLKDINKKLNLTIVVITHQMEVVKDICNKVAVMEKGVVVEEGNLLEIFSRPKTKITQGFVASIMGCSEIDKFIGQRFIKDPYQFELAAKISFLGQTTGQPFISKISIDYGIYVNVLFGNLETIQGVHVGNLIVCFSGTQSKVYEAIGFLEDNKIKVEVLQKNEFTKSADAQCNRVVS